MASSSELLVGVSGSLRNACVALSSPKRVVGICEQERVTRVRAAGVNASGLPDEALDELLRRAGRSRKDVASYVTSEEALGGIGTVLDHHLAHACAAFLSSPFETSSIVVCDHEPPYVSVWSGASGTVTSLDWPWSGVGFAEFYSRSAELLGFGGSGKEQRLEALARLEQTARSIDADRVLGLDSEGLRLNPHWQEQVACLDRSGTAHERATSAAALQARIGDVLVEFIDDVRRRIPGGSRLCLGGSLFYNSYFNSRIKQSNAFDDVFIPINPGNAGAALGAVLHACSKTRQRVSPFLGPSYSSEEIKGTLDNCKLTYQWVSETDTVGIAVEALRKGRLVAWFDGAMEWGPRALGARSIVASPFSPFVLDNLNRFLKQREPWRGYALSGVGAAVSSDFSGPGQSPFMECDFVPRDRARYRNVLPGPGASVRAHTVDADVNPRFHGLLKAFGEVSGSAMLVNTSFNGFQEPMVCSPRDAIRVFFGTGIDVLVLGQFVLQK
jgi:carbamoyltransferase